jgi:hypothetical protein
MLLQHVRLGFCSLDFLFLFYLRKKKEKKIYLNKKIVEPEQIAENVSNMLVNGCSKFFVASLLCAIAEGFQGKK